MRESGGDDHEGFYDPVTNRAVLIADKISSPERAVEVARHEVIGHYGLENMLGRDAMGDLARKITGSRESRQQDHSRAGR